MHKVTGTVSATYCHHINWEQCINHKNIVHGYQNCLMVIALVARVPGVIDPASDIFPEPIMDCIAVHLPHSHY